MTLVVGRSGPGFGFLAHSSQWRRVEQDGTVRSVERAHRGVFAFEDGFCTHQQDLPGGLRVGRAMEGVGRASLDVQVRRARAALGSPKRQTAIFLLVAEGDATRAVRLGAGEEPVAPGVSALEPFLALRPGSPFIGPALGIQDAPEFRPALQRFGSRLEAVLAADVRSPALVAREVASFYAAADAMNPWVGHVLDVGMLVRDENGTWLSLLLQAPAAELAAESDEEIAARFRTIERIPTPGAPCVLDPWSYEGQEALAGPGVVVGSRPESPVLDGPTG